MTWEETIIMINNDSNYNELVRDAYISTDIIDNVERFRKSSEFKETLKLIRMFSPNGKNILDIGCGNGISAVSFAIEGFLVTALEPDSSKIVGYGAIEQLKQHYKLSNIDIEKCYAEDYKEINVKYDIVYARQSLHHAADLKNFVANTSKVLKKGGLWISVRDHVIFNKKDKQWFLENHPLHKYYGGENAFTLIQYKTALVSAGLSIEQIIRYYDSEINYFPLKPMEIIEQRKIAAKKASLKIPLMQGKIVFLLFSLIYNIFKGKIYNEKRVSGRMYSFIAIKK
jgi:2-polyprenyl-3-methyl-5-hydroxy-6-metoxy-1,4-benzoquinol methylase